MEVILQEDVLHLGRAGEIKKVKEGFARNFLLPQKKAIVADKKNLKQLEHQKKVITAKQAKLLKQATELKEKLENFSVTIAKEAGEEDKLFGSVTSQEIADVLRNAGHPVDKRMIQIQDSIKSLGIFDVGVRFLTEVQATVKVTVVKK